MYYPVFFFREFFEVFRHIPPFPVYRTGIGGIEYQGRIRKMAAVNMYIRGLNPHNIRQGDSLKMYDPARDAGSKKQYALHDTLLRNNSGFKPALSITKSCGLNQ
jgi:hypothetical protein